MYIINQIKWKFLFKFSRFKCFEPLSLSKHYSIYHLNHKQCIIEWQNSNNQGIKRLIEAYQLYGHFYGDINPLNMKKNVLMKELHADYYGLLLDDTISSKGKNFE